MPAPRSIFAPFSTASLCIAVALFGGCNRGGDDKIHVAFVTNNPHAFWTLAERGCEKAAKDFNVQVEFRRPAQNSPKDQQDIVDKLMLMGIQGIAVSPNDGKNQADYYNDIASKVPLITQDSDLPPGSKRRCYLGTNNIGAGKAAGQMVKEVLPEGGQVVILVGSLDVQNAVERRQGVLDELGGKDGATGPQLGKHELLTTITDGGKADECKRKVEDFLVKYTGDPQKLCFVGLWAYNPHMALEAVKTAKLEGKVKVVGFDEDEPTLAGIRAGLIHGTVVQSPFEFGYEAIRILTGLVKKDESVLPAGGVLYIPFKVIKKDEVDAFEKRLNELRNPTAA